MKLKIEYLNKEQLKPYANNAKIHTGEQIEQIKNSIRQFGFNDPIAVWHGNEVIEGHGRLLAAMEMDDIHEVPVIRLDGLSDEQRRAYMLVHNKLTMNTDFSADLLSIELEGLINDIDMTELGFNEAEILEATVDDNVYEPYSKPEYSGDYGGEQPGEPYQARSFEEELKQYEQHANEANLMNKRVIIVYQSEPEEKAIKEVFGIADDEVLNVVYNIKDIIRRRNAKPKE